MDVCQYCGWELHGEEPEVDTGFLYGVECLDCPPGKRRSHMLARPTRVDSLTCPDCGVAIVSPESSPSVLVVKEMTYDVCPRCHERIGVSAVRKVKDIGGGVM